MLLLLLLNPTRSLLQVASLAKLRLQAGAGEDDVIHLPSGLGRVDCERQEEEEKEKREEKKRKAFSFTTYSLLQVALVSPV